MPTHPECTISWPVLRLAYRNDGREIFGSLDRWAFQSLDHPQTSMPR